MERQHATEEKPRLLTKDQVKKAVEALLLLKKKAEKDKLLGNDEAVNLQFAMKKVPRASAGTIKLKLPHGLGTQRNEVCLFVKDLDRKDREFEKTVSDMRSFLKSKGITTVTEIIPLKALRLEYKTFEARRNLANMYDMFLADARVIRLLPPLLGKAFYSNKRQPVQVRMDAKDLKHEFESAISNTRCILNGRGSVGMATVAHTGMSAAEITENVLASSEQLMVAIPGGVQNVRNFYLKTETSMAIPIFMSFESSNDVDLPAPKKRKVEMEPEEVSTVEGALVKALPTGIVKLYDAETGKEIKPRRAQKKLSKSAQKKPTKTARKKPTKGALTKPANSAQKKPTKTPLKKPPKSAQSKTTNSAQRKPTNSVQKKPLKHDLESVKKKKKSVK